MNQEQLMGLIRQGLPLIGGVAMTFGWLSPEQVGDLTAGSVAALGAVTTLGSSIWSLMSKTDSAIVAKAIALPAVSRIETINTKAGVELANSVPNRNVVTKGAAESVRQSISAAVWPDGGR